jgi:hypothetical protein
MQTVKEDVFEEQEEQEEQEAKPEKKDKKKEESKEDIIISNEKKELSEIDKLLKMKSDEQIKFLFGQIEILRNNVSVVENRLARYKKLKKI